MSRRPPRTHEAAEGNTMLSFEDCLALSELTEEEILAIAEHEHINEMAALAMGQYLVQTSDGQTCIKAMIADDIESARACGNTAHAAALKLVLQHYLASHPDCARNELNSGSRRP